MLQDRGQEREKAMMVRIEPDQISKVVSLELQDLYADVKERETFVVDVEFDITRQELMKALTSLIQYYTTPSEFDSWKEHDA